MTNSYLDFDLEIGKGKDGIYSVTARWQGNEAYHEAQLPADIDPIQLRQQIEGVVLDSPLRRRRAFSDNESVVKQFGQTLFDFALSGETLAQLRGCQRAAKGQAKEGVRLRLRILDPELASLPWEYLYDTRLRDFIALDPKLPLVRYLHHSHAVAPLQITPPLRILAMVASPIDLVRLDIEGEKQRVEEAVRVLKDEGRVELVWLPGESALDLQSALRKGPWHVFHFIGHGDFDARRDEGYLALCNPRNKQAEPLYATQLARLLAAQSNNLRFVLLNACESARGSSSDIFSSTAETLINRDIPAVLAMQYSITDDAATLFAQHLYESLADGLPIDRSVAEARNALALADSQNLEWGVPVLHMRSPDGVLFEMGKSGKVEELQSGIVNAPEKTTSVSIEPVVLEKAAHVDRSVEMAATVQPIPEVNEEKFVKTPQTTPVFRDEEKPRRVDTTPIFREEKAKDSAPQPLPSKKRSWLRIAMIIAGVIVVGYSAIVGTQSWQQSVRNTNATATQQSIYTNATAWAVQVQPTMTAVAAQARSTMLDSAPALRPLVDQFGMNFVFVPAGEFLMGSPEGVGESDEHPQQSVNVDSFWIGQTEITNAQFRPFVEGDGYRNETYWTSAGWKWRSDNNITQPSYWSDVKWNQSEYPVVGVSWYEAVAYGNWLSKETGLTVRLPSEAEWEKAARGIDGQTYPWGEDSPSATLLNYSDTDLQRISAVGSYPAGASPYSALDIAGNVWEWNSTAWGGCDAKPGFAYPYVQNDGREDLDAEGCRLLRGGSWVNDSDLVRGANRLWSDPENRGTNVGFRVVAVDSPGS